MGVFCVLVALTFFEGLLCQQYFRVRPHDTSVVAGHTAELHCHVGNRVGLVQWSKDGFLLGYDPNIPGYARYEMKVDHPNSAYTLLVHDARLDDEGEFQCQVGPGKNEKPIRSVARLTVLVPPESLLINGLHNGSDIEVREAEKVVLECQARSSKPATILKWFRKNIELMLEASKTSVRKLGDKRYTTVSSITLYPKGEASGVPYSCEALHPALPVSMKTTVFVQVLYPPSVPEIRGYQDGDVVQAGDRLSLSCVSKGGKPPARLVWYRNGDVLSGTYSTVGREAVHTLDLTIVPDDNNAIFGCAAVNPLTPRPLFTTINLKVLFPPTKVMLDGPISAHRGETVTVNCHTDPSNPTAEINWLVDGVLMEASETITVAEDGQSYTSSNVTATISRQETKMKSFTCYATGVPQHEPVFQSFNVSIIYPPGPPVINGYFEGEELRAGQVREFTCSADSGNPPADLLWYRGNAEVPAVVSIKNGHLVSTLSVEIEPSDNGGLIRCDVNNTVASKPLSTELQLSVLFLPTNLSIVVDPAHPKEGDEVKLECWASSSNPESKIIWWHDGRLLTGHQAKTTHSSYGGIATISTLKLRPLTSSDDGSRFTCEAKNEAFEESVKEQILLRVRYAPEFANYENTVELVEGQSGEFNITARAYPEASTYTCSKDGSDIPYRSDKLRQPNVSNEGSVLYFTNVSRQDSGTYTCIAKNTEGAATTEVTLNVLYPAIVTNISAPIETAEGDSASFECMADGNPLSENTISWRSKESSKGLTPLSQDIGKSVLSLVNVSRSHGGFIECVANNGVGKASTKSTQLIVMYRPYVLRESLHRKVAVGNRTSVDMNCAADAYPKSDFAWSYNGTTIASGEMESQDYRVRVTEKKENEWWSNLYIKKVDWTNFGVYTCVARNELGHDFITFTLAKTGFPNRPDGVEANNITHRSVMLSWRPGFDGGLPQTFLIRFRDIREANYTFLNVSENASFFQITGLEQGNVYEFAVAAQNKLGKSAFTPLLRIKTRNIPVMDSTVSQLDSQGASPDIIPTWLLVVAIICGIIVVVNMLICVGYSRRKRWCNGSHGVPGPELHMEEDEISRQKKVAKKKKIQCALEEDAPPFYLSGTTVDLPDDGLDLSSFQKAPVLRQISRDPSDDGHSSGSRRCDCGGKQWGNTLICGSGPPGHDISGDYEHQQCPDILKRDSCHCHALKSVSSRTSDAGTDNASVEAAPISYSEAQIVDASLYPRNQSPMQLSTFQPKTELPIRHTILDVIGPKLETVINGDGEES